MHFTQLPHRYGTRTNACFDVLGLANFVPENYVNKDT